MLAAAVIFDAADETFVAADDTLVAAAAGVTELFLDVLADFFAAAVLVDFLVAAVFFAPVFAVRLELAVERRAVDRVVVFVGTDPSPRVDQLRRDAFHNQRRFTHRLNTRRPVFAGNMAISR
ncbi:hypothetical protein NE236_40250 [Actinoallomurus purpureus]|uniref:hypothetical protein n=1 Tax=Actinoallomurus purpureus TaxID=478114 RepID=UPI002091F9D6|nr:hypothetical protein [Actinoallomurus purpureus]MCO6011204.1 hypothetical protein [Actinoallomurus purpureus]